jgi:serpin B
VLTDALYLNARWATPFAHALTVPGPFATASGTVTARFMHGEGYRRAAAGGWTAVALPYQGGRLAMTALLPSAGPAAASCQEPAPPVLCAITAGLYDRGGSGGNLAGVALPRVSLSSHQDMTSLLIRLGMSLAFAQSADFTGLSPQACCISTVQHAATLRVDEKGTVASAATGVGMLPTSAMREVAFNRPYLMVVTDTATGEPLFLARVASPAAP